MQLPLILYFAATTVGVIAEDINPSVSCLCTDSSFPVPFSSNFQQPIPGTLVTEYTANWNQHKWNINVSHITAGFLYNSPSNGKVRADQAYQLTLGTSIFDYNNVSKAGLVSNTLITYSPSLASKPQVFEAFVNPDFPLFTSDILISNNAVFGGLVERPYNGKVASWDILYQQVIPVTVYVDCCSTVVGYDYFSPGLRTKVFTEYFNIQPGNVSSDVFDLPKIH